MNCEKSCRPHGDKKACDECVQKMDCWLCEPKNIQKEAMRLVELGSDDKAEHVNAECNLETALSALAIVPASPSEAHVKTEIELAAESEQIAKEKDSNYDHETEHPETEHRETEHRETDAQKKPRNSTSFYTMGERGVTWEKHTEPPNSILGSSDISAFGGYTNNTSDANPGDSNTVV
jgi:hypothetical protein